MTSARPRATCKPASVTMNGSSRKRVEDGALDRAESCAAGDDEQDRRDQPPAGGSHDGRGEHARQAEQRPDRRSIPAVMMTNVMPTAMIPVSLTARTILAICREARNRIRPCRRGEKIMPPIATRHEADHALKTHQRSRRGRRGAGRKERRLRSCELSPAHSCVRFLVRFGRREHVVLVRPAGKLHHCPPASQDDDAVA